MLRLFDYDAAAPLDFKVEASEVRDGLTVETISYASPKGGRVTGVMIRPPLPGRLPAVLVGHGAPGTADGAPTMAEATSVAKMGAITLAIDAPFSRGARRGVFAEVLHLDERDVDDIVQLAVDWRRAVDLLASRPDVDPSRIAYDGRSYGAAQGGLLAGLETRIKAYALVVGDGGYYDHFTGPDAKKGPLDDLPPEQRARWLAALEPIGASHFIGRAAPTRFLFQGGLKDELVSVYDAKAYQGLAKRPKKILWYDAGHQLNAQASADRHAWLAEQLGLKPAKPNGG